MFTNSEIISTYQTYTYDQIVTIYCCAENTPLATLKPNLF